MAGQLAVPLLCSEKPSLSLPTHDAVDTVEEKPRWTQSHASTPSRILHALPSYLFLLLPSFVINYFRPGAAMKLPPPHSTSYLDGLRGIAALIVYFYHFGLMWTHFDLELGYGAPSSGNYWYQLPIVRLVISGRAGVTVFFVISGYVLSIRTLRLIHHCPKGPGQQNKILSALSSSVLRRPVRLYLPIAVATAILSILVQMRFPFLVDSISLGGVVIAAEGKTAQLVDWWTTMSALVNPFTIDDGMRGTGLHRITLYITPLWTIPTEFKGSLAVFLMLLAFSRARRGFAMGTALVVGVIWQLWRGDVDMGLFMAGMVMAEISMVWPLSSLVLLVPRHRRRMLHIAHHVAIMLLFFVALWLLSTPLRETAYTPGYKALSRMAPEAYQVQSSEVGMATRVELFWHAVGSILLVLVLVYCPPVKMLAATTPVGCRGDNSLKPADEESPRLHNQQQEQPDHLPKAEDQKHHHQPLLQSLFTNCVVQYLGTLSYSLYLLHEAVNHVVGARYAVPGVELWRTWELAFPSTLSYADPEAIDPFMKAFEALQAEGALPGFRRQYWSWYIVALCTNTVVLIWVSDLFMRAVDGPSVRFARWLSRTVEASKGRSEPW